MTWFPTLRMLAAATLLLVANASPGLDLRIEGKTSKGKARCETDGKFKAGASFSADSLFEGIPDETFVFHQAAEAILVRRFRFVEFARKAIPPEMTRSGTGGFYNQFYENKLGPEAGEKYVRIFVAQAGDERCAPFEHFVTSLPNLVAAELRWWGLPPDRCLALERTNELRAAIEHVYVPEKRLKSGKRGEWSGWVTYRERVSQRTIARVWTGGYSGGRRSYVCANGAEQKKLDQVVTSTGNPDVPLPPPVTNLSDPQFPLRRIARAVSVGPEMNPPKDFLLGRSRNFKYDDWALAGELIDNGLTFSRPYYRKHDMGFGLAGYNIYLIRPGMRRIVHVADGSRPFTDCDYLSRQQSLMGILCRAQNVAVPPERKWAWGNWLLLFEDDGTPHEIMRFDFSDSRLSGTTPFVLDFKFVDSDTLQSRVRYWRDESRERFYYEADVTFRLAVED